MQVWTGLDQVPASFGPTVVTIGNFDGVHRGHAEVCRAIAARAREDGAHAVAVTFDPHPLAVHRPEHAPELITGVRDRLDLLAEAGLDAVLLVRYTLDFAAQTPEEFVVRYLVDGLRAQRVVVGRDVRFGRDNSGTLETMVALGARHGFVVEVVGDVGATTEPAHARWSSTYVRELLAQGDVVAAAGVLGRPHRLRGEVVHGDARGRELGFPTANLGAVADGTPVQGLVPADGVYAGWLVRSPGTPAAERLPAAVSIGTNPTFDGQERRVEAYVLDRTDLDLYGEEVVVELVERLRPTLRFEGDDWLEQLLAAMNDDVARTRAVLGLDPGAPLVD
ncbi:bifunctional riboflavin kinase/FAD synthetase [Luteimicrobium subarcticum]|uniref:Riboflavin biosynthesis protein n=1 Tax=Luteimicrobium subarcticum TaxID=620910 RepID=A0A2M8WTX8_9MICO|nr:bifunctional riboflavin kinase/FAD synthetase [Luteimicrobium subarcticum]PJI94400.1 riboflavin kinase/FMN adenylyltransferase [Luteimicrobium subarcticum]